MLRGALERGEERFVRVQLSHSRLRYSRPVVDNLNAFCPRFLQSTEFLVARREPSATAGLDIADPLMAEVVLTD